MTKNSYTLSVVKLAKNLYIFSKIQRYKFLFIHLTWLSGMFQTQNAVERRYASLFPLFKKIFCGTTFVMRPISYLKYRTIFFKDLCNFNICRIYFINIIYLSGHNTNFLRKSRTKCGGSKLRFNTEFKQNFCKMSSDQ